MPVDEKVANLFNAFSGLKEKVRSRIPEKVTETAERLRINRRPDEQHEMGTFRNFEGVAPGVGGPGGVPGYGGIGAGGGQMYSEYTEGGEQQFNGNPFITDNGTAGEIDPHTGMSGKISAWQAGWNVTNAIQVIHNYW